MQPGLKLTARTWILLSFPQFMAHTGAENVKYDIVMIAFIFTYGFQSLSNVVYHSDDYACL